MNLQLKKFNNIEVINLKHLDELIENNTSEFARFDMDDHVYVIILIQYQLSSWNMLIYAHSLTAQLYWDKKKH